LLVYNSGVDQAVPQQPCLGNTNYRRFDFWLGRWRARRAVTPTPPGAASEIRSLLGGCVIAEFWGAPVRGRSLNAYDQDDRQWHQTWVSGSARGHLRLTGGLQMADMVMSGVRRQPDLVEFHNTYRWTPQGTEQLTQSFETVVRRDSTIFFQSSGAFLYTRDEEIMPGPEAVPTECQPGGPAPEARQLDFWLGQWSVSAEQLRKQIPFGAERVREATKLAGAKVARIVPSEITGRTGPRLGTANVSSGMSGCLTERTT
jgi:hypothetical protein